MRVHYLSDIHANHFVPFKNNQEKWKKRTQEWFRGILSGETGEVLVLNGDFSEFNNQTLWVLEEAAKHFEVVFFVLGNHDYYLLSKNQRMKYKTSFGRVEELMSKAEKIPNVVCLQKKVVTYKDKTFAGDTLWYDLSDQKSVAFYEEQSNDSQFIYTGIPFKPDYKVLRDLSMDWYYAMAGKELDVFVSHVPPVHPPMSNRSFNGCYVSDVPFLASKHWIAGHQHTRGTFEKAGTTFYMNPVGYPGELNQPVLASFVI